MASAVSWKCQKCSAIRSRPEFDAGADCFRCRLAAAIEVTGKASVYVENGMYVVTAQTGDEEKQACPRCGYRRRSYDEVSRGADCLYCRVHLADQRGNGKVEIDLKSGWRVSLVDDAEQSLGWGPSPGMDDPARMCQSCRRERRGYSEVHYGLDCLYCRSFEMMEETGHRAELGFNGQVFTLSPPSQTPPPAAASEVSVAFLTDIIHELRRDITELKKGLSAVEMILVAIDHRLDRMERDDD